SSRGFLRGKNAHGKMCGEPDGSEEQHDAQEQLRAHGGGALTRRFERSHVFRGSDEHEHGAEGHRPDEDGGKNGSENHFHGIEPGPPGSGLKKDSGTGGKAERRRRSASGRAISAGRTNRRPPGWNRWD